MWFKKFFIALFGFFAIFILFIFIIRIANNKTGFMGLSDLFTYFESVDFQKPIDNLVKDVTNTYNSFNNVIVRLWSWGKWLPNIILPVLATIELVKIVAILCVIMWDIFVLAIGYIQIFTNFISFIIQFEGTPAIIY